MPSTEVNSSNRSTTVNTPTSSTVFSTSNRSTMTTTPINRTTIVHILAVVGFIALIGGSLWLAAYSTRYVPGVVGRVGTAAVYLGSVFTPAPKPVLSVIPTASTTIAFGEEASSTDTSTIKTTAIPTPTSVTPTAGKKTSSTIQIGGATVPTTLSGLPDLIATINTVGYLASASAESFVATTTIPGRRPAINFTIKNVGTNVTSAWRFRTIIPTQTAYLYESQLQPPLAPGDSIDYTLGFDQANPGVQTISVTADFDNTIKESNEDNNSASAKVTISY